MHAAGTQHSVQRKFAKHLVAQNKLVVRPHLGECLEALPLADRLGAFPPLTTQLEWPVSVPSSLRALCGTFSKVQWLANAGCVFVLPALVLAFTVAAVCMFAKAHATTQTGGAFDKHSVRNIGFACVFVVCVLFITGAVVLPNAASGGPSVDAMEKAFLHPDFLNDFCPVSFSDCSPSGSVGSVGVVGAVRETSG